MDLEVEMRKKQMGDIVISKEKILITYADNVVLIAKSEHELKRMMKRFKKYIERKVYF